MGKEDLLNLAFASKLVESKDFAAWLLTRTKFAGAAGAATLLDSEQAAARAAKYWWRHWWCFVPELGAGSETDIFAAFENIATGQRFALHIENKLADARFEPGQAEGYAPRARYMLANANSALLRCTDFDTILLAPRAFQARFPEQCAHFGCFIAHEEVVPMLPSFG